MNENLFLTIFTSTYNRKNMIGRLYASLKEQHNKKFEWVVIDDGSTDGTYEYLKELTKDEIEFNIDIIRKENEGKHVAINWGIRRAKGNLFFIVDSDDYIPIDAVNKIYNEFIKIDKYKNICGISGIKYRKDGTVVGRSFDSKYNFLDISNLDIKKYGINGDRAEVFFTDILRKYPFPSFENEKFVSEAVVWNKMANDGYLLRFINEKLYCCEYQNEGLSNNIKDYFINNWNGYTFYVNQEVRLRKDLYRKITIILAYINLAYFYKKMSLREIITSLNSASPLGISVLYLFRHLYRMIVKNS